MKRSPLHLFQRLLRGTATSKIGYKGKFVALLFGLSFGAGGFGIFFNNFVKPMWQSATSNSWEETDATITHSELNNSGDSSHVEIHFRYRFRGQEYHSEEFQFGQTGATFGIKEMKAAIEDHPVGKRVIALVNPTTPQHAVINPKVHRTVWIALPFSIPFMLVGICGCSLAFLGNWAFRKGEHFRAPLRDQAQGILNTAFEYEGEELKGTSLTWTDIEHLKTGFVLILTSIFWNGIVSVFLVFLFQEENPPTYLALFLTPFTIIGIGLIIASIKSLTKEPPPGWVIGATKVTLGTNGDGSGTVNLEWLPLPEDRHRFRSCALAVIRIPHRSDFKKFNTKHPDWTEELVAMEKDTPGKATYQFEAIPSEEKASIWGISDQYDTHLILQWSGRDGIKHEFISQLSPSRDSD